MSEIEVTTRKEGMLDRGLGVWGRLAPLSAGAVATGLLAVGVGRLAGTLLGGGVRRRIGWSAVGALVPLALWLITTPNDPPRTESENGTAETKGDPGSRESVEG